MFAFALTRVDAAFAGRAFAAYGGVYIASSLVWMAVVEKTPPQATDYAGAGIWYDAIAALNELIAAAPQDAALRTQRSALLREVGLPDTTTE